LGIAACFVVALLGVAVTGVVAATQRKVLTSAADDTIAAAEGMTAATTTDSAVRFGNAADKFDSAASIAGGFWTIPAQLLPVVSQNLDAVQKAAASGAQVNRTASQIAGEVDYDRLQLDGGGIDLAVLEEFRSPVEQAEAAIAA